jgi:hypothetical protein
VEFGGKIEISEGLARFGEGCCLPIVAIVANFINSLKLGEIVMTIFSVLGELTKIVTIATCPTF